VMPLAEAPHRNRTREMRKTPPACQKTRSDIGELRRDDAIQERTDES
jgi:hypothetical protein